MSPLKVVSSHYTTLLSIRESAMQKQLSSFVLLPVEQMRETIEDNKIC